VEDHRQIVTLRQPELRVEDRLLALKLRILAIKIEADLTDGDKLVSCGLHDLIKPLNVLIKMPLNHDRMQAERGIERGCRAERSSTREK
jgi:hypothetical protein